MPSWYICGNERFRGPVFAAAAAGFTGDAATIAWCNAVVAAGGTVSATQNSRVDTLILALKGHSLFSANSRLWIHAGESVAAQATIDIMGLASNVVSGHAPTLNAGGYVADGANYIDYGSRPSDFKNTTPFTASFGAYNSLSDTTSDNTTLMGANDGTSFCDILPRRSGTSDTLTRILCAGGEGIASANANRQGFYVASRRSDLDAESYKNGPSTGTNTTDTADNSTSIAFYGLGNNGNGTPGSFLPVGRMAAAWIGGALTDTDVQNLSNDINAYMTAWGVNVY